MALKLSLLDVLALCADCETLSELRSLGPWQRVELARRVEHIEVEAASLPEWNEALSYLTGLPARSTAEAARGELMGALARWAG